MKKEVLLVLGIIEGRGWHPIDGCKTIIEANLDNHKLSTEPFPLTNAPKFNTEITWEAEKQTIRSYKLNRVPIKIECYAVDEKNNRQPLGYIVLPLTTAVEGVEVNSKWHKLLGGPATTYKTPPSLLLRLHLEAMTLDQQSGISNKPLTAFKNGKHALEEDKMSYLLERNRFLQNREELEIKIGQTNGNQEETSTPPIQNFHLPEATNGVRQDISEIDSDNMDEDVDDEIPNYDSQEEYSDPDSKDMSDVIVETFSVAEPHDRGNENTNIVNRNDQPRNKIKFNQSVVEGNESAADVQKEDTNEALSSFKNSEIAVNETPGSSKSFGRGGVDHELLMQTRTSTREHLHKLSQSLLSHSYQESPSPVASASHSHDTSSPHEKRMLEISQLLAESCEQRNKSRKVDSLSDASCSEPKGESTAENEARFLKSKLAHNHNATSAALLLSKHVGNRHISKATEQLPVKGVARRQKLIPYLNQEEGYFSIGPRDGEAEKEFVFSVTIVYAKNLSKIMSQEIIPPLRGFRFCYSLLGYSIYTDFFYDVDNPEFLAEKASAIIRSSNESLSQYFLEHYFLPVYLLSGETCLGVCRIDMAQLLDIANKSEAKVEGVYEMNPVEDTRKHEDTDGSKTKAMVAVSIELSKVNDGSDHVVKLFPTKSSPNFLTEKRIGMMNDNEIVLSDSMESGSDSEEEQSVRTKGKMLGERLCHGCRSHFSEQGKRLYRMKAEREIEYQKKALLHEAAYEIEHWKEEQQKYFLKEWTSREESLQRLIASEWTSKTKLIEGELSQRLSECDKLQEKLNSALNELSVKEEKLRLRENKVTDAEQELKAEREKVEYLMRTKESQMQKETSNTHYQNLLKQLQAEENKRVQLQKEVSILSEELANSEETCKAQTQEVIRLRRKLIQSNDIIGISKEKEALENKIASLLERKQYYKAQWQSALIDLHKIHSAHKRAIEEITSEKKGISPHDLQDRNSDYYSTACYKLRKLRDERKTLLESGLYPPNHSIIRNIDKKLRELIG